MEKKIKDAQWRKKRDEDISIRYHHGEDCELIAKKYGLSKASIPVIVSTHNQKNHTSSK
jgi:Mor family transcriptional regulator